MTGSTQTFGVAEPAHDSAEFRDLMAGVGYLMFYWTLLDQAVLHGIQHLRTFEGEAGKSKARATFAERLAEWQALASQKSRRNLQAANRLGDLASQAERLNRKRKLIVQSFTGASHGNEEGGSAIYFAEAGITAPRSGQMRLSHAELNALIEEVRSCRYAIESLHKSL